VTITVVAFYKFVEIENCARLKSDLRELCEQSLIRGTALIAREGLNAMLAGPHESIARLLAWLRADPRFADVAVKESAAPAPPFKRLKVKIKREIISFGAPDADPLHRTGTRVAPHDWNALIQAPGVAVVDTRNTYEVEAGTFEGAVNPATRSFREFPQFVAANLDPVRHPRVAMFCTGGIRCEKASAYLLSKGFAEVYQLDGGILNYLERVPAGESLWRGTCFVFDERGALGHGLEVDADPCGATGAETPDARLPEDVSAG
jgi:UPF0176 protein